MPFDFPIFDLLLQLTLCGEELTNPTTAPFLRVIHSGRQLSLFITSILWMDLLAGALGDGFTYRLWIHDRERVGLCAAGHGICHGLDESWGSTRTSRCGLKVTIHSSNAYLRNLRRYRLLLQPWRAADTRFLWSQDVAQPSRQASAVFFLLLVPTAKLPHTNLSALSCRRLRLFLRRAVWRPVHGP